MGFLDRLLGRTKAKSESKPRPAPTPSKPDFPLGQNIISDADIKTFADLGRHYPLPAGFAYQQTAAGHPEVVRAADGARFSFLIEEGMLTFNEAYTKKDGKTGYKTTEVFKQG